MKFGQNYIRVVDTLNEQIGKFAAWLTTLLVLVVCYDVFTRYWLESSSVAVQELEWHLFSVLFLLGGAFTLKHDRHVRVDVFYGRCSPLRKAWINLGGCLVFLLPFSMLGIWSSWPFIMNSYLSGEGSPNPGGLPARFILKMAIPAAFLLILLQTLVIILRSIDAILSNNDDKGEVK